MSMLVAMMRAFRRWLFAKEFFRSRDNTDDSALARKQAETSLFSRACEFAKEAAEIPIFVSQHVFMLARAEWLTGPAPDADQMSAQGAQV
jgi:hypothetical protein